MMGASSQARLGMKVQFPSRPTWLAVLAVCLAAVLPFLSTLRGYFVGDDFGLVQLFSQKPPLHFLSLFTKPWTETIYGYRADELRPMVALSYQIDALWGADSPIGYHVSSILFHTLNALLVLAIARHLVGLSLPASTFAGVLFAILPVHAEVVAWISGRADSIPTLFYLSSLLAYGLWRRSGAFWLYPVSLGIFFLALFSKQSAITMVATLALYDWLVERKPPWSSWSAVRSYVPFAALTSGYLVLRLVLFGNAVREDLITLDNLTDFWLRQATYLQMMVFGIHSHRVDTFTLWIAMAIAAVFFYGGAMELRRSHRSSGGVDWTRLSYFGPMWWAVSVAPLAVTYLSSRHLYLASVSFAIVSGIGFQALWAARWRLWRSVSLLASVALLLGYAFALLWAVGAWNGTASLSEKMGRDVQQEAMTAPMGSLVLLGAPPAGGNPRIWTWLWAFSLPFAHQPPFTGADLAERVSFISRPEVYCCGGEQWYLHARRTIVAWSQQTADPPVIMLTWDIPTGALTRRSDVGDPLLRRQVLKLADTDSPEEMRRRLEAILSNEPAQE